jgi:hypothetical protein
MTPRELCDLLTKADGYLSLLRHRVVPMEAWGASAPPLHEVDQVIGALRRESERLRVELAANAGEK